MTRKKVTLAYIGNDSARKATFKKRKKGLIKKVSELSTLCGIEACAVIYSPYDTEPEVWPSAAGARRTIARFRNMPEMDQSKRMVNQQVFLRQRIGKVEEQLKKQRRDNREKEVTELMYRALTGLGEGSSALHGLSLLDLNDLGWVVEKTLREVNERIRSLTTKSPSLTPPPPGMMSNAGNGGSSKSDDGLLQEDDQRDVKGVLDAPGIMDGVLSLQQPWYMELLKQSEGLMGLGKFGGCGGSSYSYSSGHEMMMTHNPPPPPPQSSLSSYLCPGGQSLPPWTSNFFFPS
ncbi:hypothetical protein SAY87_014628 [Trapa incisa]|uniref:MADS-box domain-containing protein n=1 Tax=Trapa incisa TaxID=236973 RepID=A0AAN7JKL3_9MYRT|nr:hypothetical protein SAY87_014628 [Trapa incisa]